MNHTNYLLLKQIRRDKRRLLQKGIVVKQLKRGNWRLQRISRHSQTQIRTVSTIYRDDRFIYLDVVEGGKFEGYYKVDLLYVHQLLKIMAHLALGELWRPKVCWYADYHEIHIGQDGIVVDHRGAKYRGAIGKHIFEYEWDDDAQLFRGELLGLSRKVQFESEHSCLYDVACESFQKYAEEKV